MPPKKKPVSNYTLLNRWLFDGSSDTIIPPDVMKDTSISQLYLLYYFQGSHYSIYIDKTFNNYGIFSLDRADIFKFMKQCIQLSGYKPPFVKRGSKSKSKMVDALKEHYPFLKREEVFMVVDNIDASDDKDAIYEMFGFYKPKKKKTTKAEKKKMEKHAKVKAEAKVSLDDLMGNFDDN
jgi:hypothetical protein